MFLKSDLVRTNEYTNHYFYRSSLGIIIIFKIVKSSMPAHIQKFVKGLGR